MKQHMLVDASNVVINIIDYDGISPYDPPEGLTMIEYDENTSVFIGGTWEGTVCSNPNPQPKDEAAGGMQRIEGPPKKGVRKLGTPANPDG